MMREDYVEKIRVLMGKLRIINETPEYTDEELPLKPVKMISSQEITMYYDLFDVVADHIMVFREKSGDDFVAGANISSNGDIINFMSIMADKYPFPIRPTQLRPDSIQIRYVGIDESFAKQGITSAVYQSIASKIDFISDYIHFRGAKRLWQSLANNSMIPIYVFDGYKNDYMRNDHGVIITYNGKNITEESIWGGEDKQKVLLVASTSPKK